MWTKKIMKSLFEQPNTQKGNNLHNKVELSEWFAKLQSNKGLALSLVSAVGYTGHYTIREMVYAFLRNAGGHIIISALRLTHC
jgi:hypothetical protein